MTVISDTFKTGGLPHSWMLTLKLYLKYPQKIKIGFTKPNISVTNNVSPK